jgi:putative FmdB family regulatory protein
MPIYEYECPKHNIFEEIHDIDEKIEFCPMCLEEGVKQEVQKVISLCCKGVVELYGQELVSKLKSDAKQIQKEAAKDDNKYASLLGEDKYHKLQTQLDRRNK